MGASRARATPVAGGERGKPTLVEARHQEDQEEEEVRRLMARRGFSCPQAKDALATPMGGGGGRRLARMSLEQGSLVVSLVVNNRIVEAAATTVSPSTTTTMGSTATSKTRDSTTKTRALTTRTRGSTAKTTDGASATTA